MFETTEYCDVQVCTDLTQAAGGGAVAGVLNGCKVILFTNVIALTKQTALADLTQPTYTGYAPVAVTWDSPHRDSNGDIAVDSQLVSFNPTAAPATAVEITGVGIEDAAGTHLLGAANLPEPAALVDTLSTLKLVIHYNASDPPNSQIEIVQ